MDNTLEKRRFLTQGMFAKDKDAAGAYLLEASKILLEGGEVPAALRNSLGQALREAALVALDEGNAAASDVLLKSFGLKKGGSDLKLIQAARAGATNAELAERFNVGKDQVAKKLKSVKSQELELLNRRLSHTVGRLIRMLDEMERGALITKVTDTLKEYLTSQNLLVSSDDIEAHVQDALKLAQAEHLIIVHSPAIFRNTDMLP